MFFLFHFLNTFPTGNSQTRHTYRVTVEDRLSVKQMASMKSLALSHGALVVADLMSLLSTSKYLLSLDGSIKSLVSTISKRFIEFQSLSLSSLTGERSEKGRRRHNHLNSCNTREEHTVIHHHVSFVRRDKHRCFWYTCSLYLFISFCSIEDSREEWKEQTSRACVTTTISYLFIFFHHLSTSKVHKSAFHFPVFVVFPGNLNASFLRKPFVCASNAGTGSIFS